MAALRVLYLHATGTFGGASKSLCEMLLGMPKGSVDALVLCPPGTAADQFRRAGARVEVARGIPKWDHTRFSFYRGVRWILPLREAIAHWFGWRAVRRLHGGTRVDLVHANDITVLPFAAKVARLFGVPLVVHARSLQNDDPSLRRTRWQHDLLRRSKAHVIAIDETVRRTLPRDYPVTVIHNGLRVPEAQDQPAPGPRPFRVAIIGVLLRLKGVFEFVEAAQLCRERGMQAEFWIVGENAHSVKGLRGWLTSKFGFAEDVRAGLEEQIRERGLESTVRLLGFVDDVASIYRQIDVLCFPSYLDAAGRPVFEAAWFGLPSIVAVREPMPDTIRHEQSGLCIERPDAEALRAAIQRLHDDAGLRARLGAGARELAHAHFNQERNSRSVLELYRRTHFGPEAETCQSSGMGVTLE